MDREAWRAMVHGVAKSRTWLSNWTDWTELNLTLEFVFITTAPGCFFFSPRQGDGRCIDLPKSLLAWIFCASESVSFPAEKVDNFSLTSTLNSHITNSQHCANECFGLLLLPYFCWDHPLHCGHLHLNLLLLDCESLCFFISSFILLAVLGVRCCTQAFSCRGDLVLLSTCGVQASHWGSFSCCGAWALGCWL